MHRNVVRVIQRRVDHDFIAFHSDQYSVEIRRAAIGALVEHIQMTIGSCQELRVVAEISSHLSLSPLGSLLCRPELRCDSICFARSDDFNMTNLVFIHEVQAR